MFAIYCCIGIVCFIFFYDTIEGIVIPNDIGNNAYVIALFYIFCILGWPLLIISFIQDKFNKLDNNIE